MLEMMIYPIEVKLPMKDHLRSKFCCDWVSVRWKKQPSEMHCLICG